MNNIHLNQKELTIILQALYYYEDNKFFANQKDAEDVIKKLESIQKLNNTEWVLCDY